MVYPSLLMSQFATAKRAACDRCRKHKVACPPRNNIELDCDRCVRAGAVCVTGYMKPLGKPTIRCQSNTPNDAVLTTACSSPGQGSQASHLYSFCDATDMAEPIEPWSFSDVTEDDELISGSQDLRHEAASLFHPEGLQTWWNGTDSASSLETLHQNWHSAPPSEQNVDAGQNQQRISFPWSLSRPLSVPEQSPSFSCSARKDLEVAEYNVRLSQLRVNLARQILHQQGSNPEQQPRSMTDETETAAAESPREPLCSHALGAALSSTSEFLDIIQSYKRLSRSAQHVDNPTMLLDLLSFYFHLVSVFNYFFRQLYDALGSGSFQQDTALRGLHPLPNLNLSGFAVSGGKLQTRILLQAAHHQFKQIERNLGVPPEHAVSLRTRDANDSICDNRLRTIFQAVFSKNQNGPGITVSPSSTSTLRTSFVMISRRLDEIDN
ncbi:uncharacterized protein J7T54_003694 [Emericellopsis cladophorae]|uniref:Zn(2)-C6 fungal-type domain-containing protein n=1 Tax=Emericellopsis cladophorae TaxID=2686198 RepID=A0A9Q0BB06_9HYPO|nr:uncharacterized protein J7T54_003694 [Emericellopsis cladophorae]KAI6777544.1 hypothetical protein J7T54_003694 [Emericellopsis cladophorae]